MSYAATVTCTFCGYKAEVECPDPDSLRDEIDSIGCWHACCSICKQGIVWYEDGWWHLAAQFSEMPGVLDPRGVDLDSDHQAVPAQRDGEADG